MLLSRLGPIVQIGYVVDDLDASVRTWFAAGIGPWTVFTNVTMRGHYRGVGVSVAMNVALGYKDSLQIELIQQTNAAPSPYLDDAGRPIVGPHHVAWLVDNLDEALAQSGEFDVVFRAENPTTRVAYLTAAGQPGLRFELIESEMTAQLIRTGIEAARTWDGSIAISVIDLAGT